MFLYRITISSSPTLVYNTVTYKWDVSNADFWHWTIRLEYKMKNRTFACRSKTSWTPWSVRRNVVRHCVLNDREIHVGKTIPPVLHVEQTVLYSDVIFIVFQRVRTLGPSVGKPNAFCSVRTFVSTVSERSGSRRCAYKNAFVHRLSVVGSSLGRRRTLGTPKRGRFACTKWAVGTRAPVVCGLLLCSSRKRANFFHCDQNATSLPTSGRVGYPNTQRSVNTSIKYRVRLRLRSTPPALFRLFNAFVSARPPRG